MKAYVDCGAFRGRTIERFLAKREDRDEFRVWAFECNPLLGAVDYGSRVTIIRKAVWTADEMLPLYVCPGDSESEGPSLHKEKLTGNLDVVNPVLVGGIDFSKWISTTFNSFDILIVKMNIEGAEYDVLPKMVWDKSIELVSELHIQWHWQKLGMVQAAHEQVRSMVHAACPGIVYDNNDTWESL